MRFLNKLYYKLFKIHTQNDEMWSSFYTKDAESVKFTDRTIYEYLKLCVGNNLDYYALNYFGTRITYGEMFRHINTISKSLAYLNIKKGDVVSICMPNTPEAVMSFYAINNLGAIADMIHPLSAPNEIKHSLIESEAKVLILYDANYEKYKDIIKETNVQKTVILSVSESMPIRTQIGYQILKGFKIKKAPKEDKSYLSWKEFISLGKLYHKNITNGNFRARDLAIILHSGGTTGSPKGIMISNYNFNALAIQGKLVVNKVKPKDRIMTILPIFHGFGLGVVTHCPLTLKAEVILIPEFDAKGFAKIIKDYKPSVIAGVPTLWEGILSNKYFQDLNLSALKYVISGGDYLTVALENKFNDYLHQNHAQIDVCKGYGMTESVAATAFTVEGANKLGSVGVPLYGNKFMICNPETNEELTVGEEGEICVTGPTIMMGYLNNKEDTNKVLKEHGNGQIWLHTGDAGYIDQDGLIYFTQRFKRMIITSGYNVYPSQIEEIIERHPKVKQCCVIGKSHPYKMQIAKAFIVLDDGIEPNLKIEAEIRLLCKKNLAVYSVPKEYEFRSELPKTPYNKVDYKLLEEEEKKKNI